jgi:hypothetical protein
MLVRRALSTTTESRMVWALPILLSQRRMVGACAILLSLLAWTALILGIIALL